MQHHQDERGHEPVVFLPREAGEGDHAEHGGGGMRTSDNTFERARDLRRRMSLPEIVLWQAMRKARLAGLRFRRQHPIGPYIIDFDCPAARLAVEVDGFAHDSVAQAHRDERRQTWLAQQGVRVLRIRASDVLTDQKLEGVLLGIKHAAGRRQPPPARSARHLRRLAGEEPDQCPSGHSERRSPARSGRSAR